MVKLRILIVEDEPPTARYIERCCRSVLVDKIQTLEIHHTLKDAADAVLKKPIDLCFLDLNLKGENGYELLRTAVAGSFHTIIISAHTEQAVEAFKYGVLDFIPKPFDEEDLRNSLYRYFNKVKNREIQTQYISTRNGNKNILIPVEDIIYFKAADVYVEAYLENGETKLLNKTMDRLEQLLPSEFFRIHRSYITAIPHIHSYSKAKGGTCQVFLKNGVILPLSRRRYKDLHGLMTLS
jgi:DNA-binding LytR/AlgR family response regulator